MLKKLLITTAVGGLIASGAIAQTPPTSPPAKSPPAKSEPAKPTMKPEVQKSAPQRPEAQGAAKNMVITEQNPDQWLFSSFKGTDVIGAKNEKIGDVNDVLFDKDGKVHALIIGVGGFLGIGEKQVALNLASFEVVTPAEDRSEHKLRLSMTKEQLQQAAEFKPYSPPRPAASPRPGAPGAPGNPTQRP